MTLNRATHHIMFQNKTDDSYFEIIVSNALFRTGTSNLFKALKFHFSFEVSSPFQLFGYRIQFWDKDKTVVSLI